jgi:hypothetical protein
MKTKADLTGVVRAATARPKATLHSNATFCHWRTRIFNRNNLLTSQWQRFAPSGQAKGYHEQESQSEPN